MYALLTQGSLPEPTHDEKPELLSVKAQRLAERIAGLVERTLNLYEAHLVIAEANPPIAEPPADEHPSPPPAPRQARTRNESTPRVPTGGVPLLTSLKRLVGTMESLLRAARIARELETTDTEKNEKSWMDPDALRKFLQEAEQEVSDAEPMELEESDHLENETGSCPTLFEPMDYDASPSSYFTRTPWPGPS